jgi:hypothetical protein
MVNTLPKNGYNKFQDAELSEYFLNNSEINSEYSINHEENDVFNRQRLEMETIAIAGEISNDGNTIVKAREGYMAEIAFQSTEE